MREVILKSLCDCFHSYISPRSYVRQCITRIPGQVHLEVEAYWLVPVAPPTGLVVPGLYVNRRHEGPASQTAFRLHPNFIHRWGTEGGRVDHRPKARTSLTAEFVVSLWLAHSALGPSTDISHVWASAPGKVAPSRDIGNTTHTAVLRQLLSFCNNHRCVVEAPRFSSWSCSVKFLLSHCGSPPRGSSHSDIIWPAQWVFGLLYILTEKGKGDVYTGALTPRDRLYFFS